MITGRVKRLQQSDPRKVQVLDRHGAVRSHVLWQGNPRIAGPTEIGNFNVITDGGGRRPYIVDQNPARFVWRRHECTPGEIYLTAAEKAFGERHQPEIVIEPWLKPKASPNKLWKGWKDFVRIARASGYRLTQIGPGGTRVLQGVEFIETPDFRRACAVLARAKAYVGHEGACHHAAAALNVPAVVIRGAYISPEVTGYPGQRDLFRGEGLGCGSRSPCGCCAVAMGAITPEMVLDELKGIL